MASSPSVMMMICRSADEPLVSGAIRGKFCAVCGREVQVSVTGQERIKQMPSVIVFCNPCGVLMATLLADNVEGMLLHPEAAKTLRRIEMSDPVYAEHIKRFLDKMNASREIE